MIRRVWSWLVAGVLVVVLGVAQPAAGVVVVGVSHDPASVVTVAVSGGGNHPAELNESWGYQARAGYLRFEDHLGIDRTSLACKAGYATAMVADVVIGGVGLAKAGYHLGEAAYMGVKVLAKQGAKGTVKAVAEKATRSVQRQVERFSSRPGVKSAAGGACSFAGETPVLMGDGSLVAIKDVRPGDGVVATDPETGEQIITPVEQLHAHYDTLVVLDLEGEQLTTTLNHPFWSVTDQHFEAVSDLSPGEQVLTAEGTTLTVTGIKAHAAHTGWAYNLSVNTIHTYHVGTHHTLVHNTCGDLTLYHGTSVDSALDILNGGLDASKAAARHLDGPGGFHLASEVSDAEFFAARRSPGTVLRIDISPEAAARLGQAGMRTGPIPAGPKSPIFAGTETRIPSTVFDLFNQLRASGAIRVSP